MVYALQIEDLDRQINTFVLAALLSRANGNDVPIPDPAQIRADFDRGLATAPQQVDAAQFELMQALGLRE